MFSFTFGLLVLDRTERNCIKQLVYYLSCPTHGIKELRQ